ncbi:MAG: DUF5666 domain-containing protein, partial [Syntrophomonadaceae bacterium]
LTSLATATLLLSGAATARATQAAGTWSGTVAAAQGDDVALVGVPAHFRAAGSVTEVATGRSLTPSTLAPGTSVTLRVGDREADGRLRADRIEVRAKSPLTVTGAIASVADDRRHVEVEGVEIELDRSTGFSGRLRSSRDLAAGMSVAVALVPTTAGTLRASEVRLSAAEPEPGEDREIRGVVQAVGDASWTIDGTVLGITDQTVFEGDPAVGDVVEARFHADAAGNLLADRIEVEDAADAAEADFRGIVEAIGADSWTISGRVVGVNAATQILGAPVVGDEVEVHASTAADGSLTATAIQREDANDDNGGATAGNDDGSNHDANDDHGGSTPATGSGNDGSPHDTGDDNGGAAPSPTGGGSHHGHGGDDAGIDN